MQISPVGFLVFGAVFLLGYYCRGPLIVPLIASLAFGATALMTLSSIGGSSPLIYSFFGVILIMAAAVRRRIWRDLGEAFGTVRPIWMICGLMLYAIVGAWLFPRLFAGQTTVFVQSSGRLGIVEASLAPVSGNISQTAYFTLGCLTAIALCVLLLHRDRIDQVRLGFFLWCGLHTGMGVLDLLAKLAGLGDVLAPIRTASYAMLTETMQGGFWRISGALSEASSFGGGSLACLPFLYVYWRRTKSRLARDLGIVLLVLMVLCTSTTAYVGLAALSIPVFLSVLGSVFAGRVERDELWIIALVFSGIGIVLAISLLREGFFNPFIDLIDTMVIDKGSSASAQERAYWNIKSLRAFMDTGGLGVALGSSRASSWLVAVVSQLGLIGSTMMALLLAVVIRGLGRLERYVDPETSAVVASVRASALGGLIAASLAAGSADPGIIFFTALAVISATRARARKERLSQRASDARAVRQGEPGDGSGWGPTRERLAD